MNQDQKNPYEDILYLPHHRSAKHPHMSLSDRAAQFAPFAALTGHEEAILETGRRTMKRPELDENEKALLDARMQSLLHPIPNQRKAVFTYFCPDKRKSGGSLIHTEGIIKKLDRPKRLIYLESGETIPLDDITEIRLKEEDSEIDL